MSTTSHPPAHAILSREPSSPPYAQEMPGPAGRPSRGESPSLPERAGVWFPYCPNLPGTSENVPRLSHQVPRGCLGNGGERAQEGSAPPRGGRLGNGLEGSLCGREGQWSQNTECPGGSQGRAALTVSEPLGYQSAALGDQDWPYRRGQHPTENTKPSAGGHKVTLPTPREKQPSRR